MCRVSKQCIPSAGDRKSHTTLHTQRTRSHRGGSILLCMLALMVISKAISQPLRSERPSTTDGIPLSCNLYNDANYHFNNMDTKGKFPPRVYQYRPQRAPPSDQGSNQTAAASFPALIAFETECVYVKSWMGEDTGGYSLIKVCLQGFALNFKTMIEYSRDAAQVQNLLRQSQDVNVQQYLAPFTEVSSVVAVQRPRMSQVSTSNEYVTWVEADHTYPDRYRIRLYSMTNARLMPVSLAEASEDTSFLLPSICGQWMAYQMYHHRRNVWSVWLYDIAAQYADVVVSSYNQNQHFHPILMDAQLEDPHIRSNLPCSASNLHSGCPDLQCRLMWVSSSSKPRSPAPKTLTPVTPPPPSDIKLSGKTSDESGLRQEVQIHRVDLPLKIWHSPTRLDVLATRMDVNPNRNDQLPDFQGMNGPFPSTSDGNFTVLLDVHGSGDLLFLLVGKPSPDGTSLSAYKILRYNLVDASIQDLPGSESAYPTQLLSSDEHGLLFWQCRDDNEKVVLVYKVVHLNEATVEVPTTCAVVRGANVTSAVLYKDVVVWEEFDAVNQSSQMKLMDLNKDNDFLFDVEDYFPFIGEYTLDSDNDGVGDESDMWTTRGSCVTSRRRGTCTNDLVYLYALWALYVVVTSGIATVLVRMFYKAQHAKAVSGRVIGNLAPGLMPADDEDGDCYESAHSQSSGILLRSRGASLEVPPSGRIFFANEFALRSSSDGRPRYNIDHSFRTSLDARAVAESDECMFDNALFDENDGQDRDSLEQRSFTSVWTSASKYPSTLAIDSAHDETALKRGFAVANALKVAQQSFAANRITHTSPIYLSPMLSSLEVVGETGLVMLTVLSLVMAVVPFWNLNPISLKTAVTLTWMDFYITHFFVLDLVARYVLRDPVHVPGFSAYLKRNWMDLTALATDIPGISSVGALRFLILSRLRHLFKMLRLIRVLKVFRFMRMYRSLVKHTWLVHLMLSKPAVFVSILVAMIAVACAAAIKIFEQGEQPVFQDFTVSMWLTVVTMTTTGYGDYAAKTIPGRLVCGFLMMIGVGGLGLVTATLMKQVMSSGEERRKVALRKRHRGVEFDILKSASARLCMMCHPMLAVYDSEQRAAFFASDEQVEAASEVHKSSFMNRSSIMELEGFLPVEIRMRQDIQAGDEIDPMVAIEQYERSTRQRAEAEMQAVRMVIKHVDTPKNVTLPGDKLLFILHNFRMRDGKEAIKDFDALYADLCVAMFEHPYTSCDLIFAKAMALHEAMAYDGALPDGMAADLQDPLGLRLLKVEEVLTNHNVHYRSDYFEILLELVVLMTMYDRMLNCAWALQNTVHKGGADKSPRPYQMVQGRGGVGESMYHLVPSFDFVYNYLDSMSPADALRSYTKPQQLSKALESVASSHRDRPAKFKKLVKQLQGVVALNSISQHAMHPQLIAATVAMQSPTRLPTSTGKSLQVVGPPALSSASNASVAGDRETSSAQAMAAAVTTTPKSILKKTSSAGSGLMARE